MKKLLSILFSLLLVATCVPVSASTTSATASISNANLKVSKAERQDLGIAQMKQKASASSLATTSSVEQTAQKISTEAQFTTFFENPSVATVSIPSATTFNPVVGYVTVPKNGTVIIQHLLESNDYYCNAKLGSYTGTTTKLSGEYVLIVPNVKAGTYALTVNVSSGDYVQGAFASAYISNANNQVLSSSFLVTGSTGNTMYQQFKVGKRGIATLQVSYLSFSSSNEYSVTYDIQKKSGTTWVTIRKGAYGMSTNNFAKVFGLNAGTYRIKYKAPNYALVLLRDANRAVTSSSYGTSKSKASSISKGTSKTQTLIAGESTSKAQWYKFKITSTKQVQFETSVIGSDSSIYFLFQGPTLLKSKKSADGTKLTWTGTVKKGTYYIKVYKTNAQYSGAYKIKYIK